MSLHDVSAAGHSFDRDGCTGCGRCAGACPNGALELCGHYADSSAVMDVVRRDMDFYLDSGGGMTLSGGEPASQSEFAIELLSAAKSECIHTCVETCGFCPLDALRGMAEYTDLFLYDIKLSGREAHLRYTGAGNDLILTNLKSLSDYGAKIVLRCPIIPDVNLTDEHFVFIAETALSLKGVVEIDLEPYHPMGVEKARRLGRPAAYANSKFLPGDTLKDRAEALADRTGLEVKIQ